MRVVVLGAGVVGVVTAYYLARRGFRVTVIDRAGSVASGTSHANGGQLSYSFTDALGQPELLRKLPAMLLGRDAAIRVRARPALELLRWSAGFLRECKGSRPRDNTLAVLNLALRSATLLDELMEQVPLEFSFARAGKLALVSGTAGLEAARRSVSFKKQYGCDIVLLSSEAARKVEPALERMPGRYAGAIYSKNDHVADARAFTEGLAGWLEQSGLAEFRMNESVAGLVVKRGRLQAVLSDRREYAPDAAVACLGSGSAAILRPLGVDARICPVRGYSLTLPPGPCAPSVSLSDLQHKIVFSRLGGMIRIAGFADFLNEDTTGDRARTHQLAEVARRIAPEAADYDVADRQEWGGFRAVTPDSRPRVGRTPVRGLYLNTGHGMLGWTLACATAEKIADGL